MAFKHSSLDNGLTLLTDTSPAAQTAAVGFFVRTGARDEPAPLMGVSHFLEHMMFKGTSRRSADDVNREFDELGANYNAFTSWEQTVYYAHVLPQFLPRAIDLLGDMLRPSLREADFEMERNVILEEIGMYDDQPHWVVNDRLMELHYSVRPQVRSLGHRILGTQQTVKDLTPQAMRDYFRQQYAAGNITVAITGPTTHEEAMHTLQQATAHWGPLDAEPTPRPTPPPNLVDGTSTHREDLHDDALSRAYLAFAADAPSVQSEHRHAAHILTDLLGDDGNSRLHWALVDPGHAEEASLGHDPRDGVGLFVGSLICEPGRLTEMEARAFDVIDRLAQDLDVTDEECERSANKIAVAVARAGERPAGQMQHLGGTWAALGTYRSLDQELSAYRAVTRDDVHAVLEAYPLSARTVVTLTPG